LAMKGWYHLSNVDIQQLSRNFIDNRDEPVFFSDREGLIIFCNKKCTDLLGYDESEINKLTIHKLIGQEDVNLQQKLFDSVENTGKISFDTSLRNIEGITTSARIVAGKITDTAFYFIIKGWNSLSEDEESHLARLVKLVELAEKRDPDAGEHTKRIRNYARIIAKELSTLPKYQETIDIDYLQRIYDSAPLYDIGKIGIPDMVMHKPGKLTEEEFELIRRHTVIGAQVLEGPKYFEMARDIALYHHEKFDGSGYPEGLTGEIIPLPARIVALADVYDAMTTNRVYREASSHERTCKLIEICSGGQFDPDVVDAFNARAEDFRRVREIYR
jgi:PAS domain S-box-containing protein